MYKHPIHLSGVINHDKGVNDMVESIDIRNDEDIIYDWINKLICLGEVQNKLKEYD